MTYGKSLNHRFLHVLLLLLLHQTAYLKIGKRTHFYFSTKQFLSLQCMILEQENRHKIPHE